MSTTTTLRPFNWTAALAADEALAQIVVDFVAPIWPGSNLIRATDGRCYVHEFNRWDSDPVVREYPRDHVDFPLLQDYPFPQDGPIDLAPASGVIGEVEPVARRRGRQLTLNMAAL